MSATELEQIKKRLAEAESLIEALRKNEIDAVVGKKSVAMLRLREIENELHDRQHELERQNIELLETKHTLEKRTRELEIANKDLETLSYSVSHDLRNPLQLITSFVALLSDEYGDKLEGDGKLYLDQLITASHTMGKLIDELLNIFRINTLVMQKEQVDLSSYVNETLVLYRQSDPERNVHLIIEPDVYAECDKRLIQHVLDNLISNAWKYTAKKDRTKIQFGTTDYDRKLTYFIRDNGTGFKKELADRLFVAFKRLHSPKEFSGSGVGLAIVQRIISRHGGQIWAESELGEGSTFYFTLG